MIFTDERELSTTQIFGESIGLLQVEYRSFFRKSELTPAPMLKITAALIFKNA